MTRLQSASTFAGDIGPLGFEVAEAKNGRDAVERLRGGAVHPLLPDWNMPVMNGMLLTTENAQDEISQASEAGAVDQMMQPLTSEIIAGKVLLGFPSAT